jgi:oligopeptide transport system substrate-binding protein
MTEAKTRRAFLASAGGAALFLAAGCGDNGAPSGQTGTAASAAASAGILRRGNGAEPKSLDPHHTEGTWESNVTGDLLMGLTTEDAAGKPVPGAATNWDTSPDGKVWTFHLRDHLWSDGTPVTAADFVYAWQRILNPKTAAAYASILYLFKNAEAINSGKMPPGMLGAKAVDDKTLQLELEHPAPYVTELMTHNTTYPVPRHVVDAKGDAWTRPENYVCNGAYVLKDWIPNDHITLEKNPKFYDAANVKIERTLFYPTVDADAALKRFRGGELDVQDGIPMSQIDWLRANMASMLQIKPYLGLSYLLCNHTRKPFDDVRVRESLNLAYDRETMTNKIIRLGEPPAYSFVPPGVANYPGGNSFDFKSLAYPDRVKKAQGLMQQAGFGPTKRLRTTLAISTSPDAKRVGAVVQQMWKAVFVDVDLVSSEPQINYMKLQSGEFDIGGAGWIADYDDARNFLFLLMENDGGLNYGRYKNPKFDALMVQSDQEADAVKRGQLMAQAEKIAMDDYAWIPTLDLVTTNLVRPYVKGWEANIRDLHRTRWLTIDEAARANAPHA